MIFADTGALFAYVVPDDEHHQQAKEWVRHNRIPLLTTDYVVDEALTLLRARGQSMRAVQLGDLLFAGTLADLYYLTPEDIVAGWQVFRAYSDKAWSFTDCTSKVVIERLRVSQAFAFDQHFRQFGTVEVVP